MGKEYLWWQRGIIYQVYPRSFMDSDGDGIGDLEGIRSRVGYLKELGVEAVWLSPIFPSPMADFGYDVADYTGIEPMFGNMEDFDRLLAEVHGHGMKMLLDLVPNHSSDQHRWFVESRSSRDNPKRDWYIWKDAGTDGEPPNNWTSVFGGSAWEWDEATGQYYLHSFAVEQPDLNWRNPEVEAAMFDAVRFWLDKGVDGFRVDVIYYMIKDEQFRDNPPNPDFVEGGGGEGPMLSLYNLNRPEVHDVIKRMRAVFDEYEERVMIAEIYLPYDQLMMYYGENGDEAHLPFNFRLIQLPWDAEAIRDTISRYEGALPEGGWPNWVLGNHDQHRIATRVGRAQARVANMLLLTLRGTPTCYYGDEIGMIDGEIPPELVRDPQEIGMPGLGLGRDPERTPMQWDNSRHAGFSTFTPWLPVAADYEQYNVEAEKGDSGSMLAFVRKLMELRNGSAALSVGSYTAVPTDEPDVMGYVREHEEERILVVLNLSHRPRIFRMKDGAGEVLLSTVSEWTGREDLSHLELDADEGIIIRL